MYRNKNTKKYKWKGIIDALDNSCHITCILAFRPGFRFRRRYNSCAPGYSRYYCFSESLPGPKVCLSKWVRNDTRRIHFLGIIIFDIPLSSSE